MVSDFSIDKGLVYYKFLRQHTFKYRDERHNLQVKFNGNIKNKINEIN